MTSFVDFPVDKLTNRENYFSRVERLERRTGARSSAEVGQLSQLGQNTGDMVVDGSIVVVNRADGVADITMNDAGLEIRNQQASLFFAPTVAGTGELSLYSDGGDFLVLYNSIGGKGITFLIDDAAHNVTQIDFTDAGIDLFDGSVNVPTGQTYKVNNVSVLSGASASWSPTWTNLTVGDGAVVAKYTRLGPAIFYEVELVFGGTTSISGDVSFSAPVTATSEVGGRVGWARMTSAGTAYLGEPLLLSSTAITVRVNNASGTYLQNTALSSTVPGVWTTNDTIRVGGMYFAA